MVCKTLSYVETERPARAIGSLRASNQHCRYLGAIDPTPREWFYQAGAE